MITTLSFYDFDATLMDTPMPETGKLEWKNKTGENYRHVGWWGRPDSLNTEVFDINPFPSILNQFRSDATKSDTYTVLLTSRIKKLQPAIENVLKLHNIEFDALSLKSGGGEKDDRIREFLNRFPDVDTINVYDDRDKEMVVFAKMKDELGGLYQINVYRVTDGNFALVESNNKLNKIISEELKILINESKVNAKERLKSSKSISKEMKEKILPFVSSGSKYNEGGVINGLIKPDGLKSKTPKIDGVSLGADKNGFFVYTHRARSKSYKSPEKIPIKYINFINSTG